VTAPVGVVGVVGAGLIGTSIGLALARVGERALLVDADADKARTAAALGAGEAVEFDALAGCGHVVVAVPPHATPEVVERLLRLTPDVTVSDVASAQANVRHEVETRTPEMSSRYCGAHPIAGRERGGPGAAQPELFDGATWVVCPVPATAPAVVEATRDLAHRCGARTVVVDPVTHDRVLAAVSHAPQLVASALAARLAAAGPDGPVLAGQGFRDTTRLADSDPALWASIAASNAGPLARELRALSQALADVAAALDAGDARAVAALVGAGREARALLPGKAAAPRPVWARVGVVLADRPGELARLFTAAGEAGVNVEDVAIEHAPDHPVGYVDLDVRPEQADRLLAALREAGWAAHRDD
jgi:prephenate dehydrogenase